MTRPGSMQRLRIDLARMLHKLPSEIDSIDYEDALRLAIASQLEAEEVRGASPSAGGKPGGKTRTTRTVYKLREK